MASILLIEDDKLIVDMYQRAFSLVGIEIETASNGKDGLQMAQQNHPKLILLDVMMPEMNGLDVLKLLKDDPATAAIPVVMLTNVSEFPIVNHATNEGAVKYIVKSEAEPQVVVKTVQSMLATSAGSGADTTAGPTSDPAANATPAQ